MLMYTTNFTSINISRKMDILEFFSNLSLGASINTTYLKIVYPQEYML